MEVFCAACDHQYPIQFGQRNRAVTPRCPSCQCRHWSRRTRADVDALCRQWQGLPAFVLKRMGIHFHADAESAAWLGLLLAARRWDSERGVKFNTYATWAIYNDIGTALKKNENRRARDAGENGQIDAEDLRTPSPLHAAATAENAALVNDALGRIDRRRAAILQMRFHQGLNFEEIGARLGLSSARVGALSRLALDDLRKAIERPRG
jgi:RNA polymerase sigma factor (sigma-70 family)